MDTPREAQRRAAAIGLATLRLDGFVSLDAGDAEAILVTAPLPCAGAALTLNARVMAPGGYVAVEALDTQDRPVPGLERTVCDVFTGDTVRHTVTWHGSDGLERLRDERIKLRFTLRHASLYAYTI